VDIAEKLKPGRTYFTHFCHDIEHDELKNSLPKKIEPAYDGLSFSL
jgi:phosphoribosyl 1,2-cyclic phosphate phosphodiesterase